MTTSSSGRCISCSRKKTGPPDKGMIKKQKPQLAFTLTEMILVISLISLLSVAAFQSLTNGIKVWDRSRRFDVEEDMAIVLDRFAGDVRQALDYSLGTFDGTDRRVVFFTRVRTQVDKALTDSPDMVEQIGSVEYVFRQGNNSLYRRQANYGQSMKKRFGNSRRMAKDIYSMRFVYYVFEDGEMKSKARWTGPLPAGVKIVIDVMERSGRKRRITRYVPVPLNFAL